MGFPSDDKWTPLLLNGSPLFDPPNDEFPGSTDIVGDSNFPAAYFAYDGTNIFIRIRLKNDPRAQTGFRQFAWGALINTDGVDGTYQWLLSVDGLNERIDLIQNTIVEFNSWNDPAEGTDGRGSPNFSIPISNYNVARARLTNDGSNFGGVPNYFLEFTIPASILFSYLGINENTVIKLLIYTSATINVYNKDSLQNQGFTFIDGFTDDTTPGDNDVRARLTTEKTLVSGPSTVVTGSLEEWTGKITVSNIGKSTATQVFVEDNIRLDTTSSFSIDSLTAGSASYNYNTNTLSWDIGNIAAEATAELQFTVRGTFNSVDGGVRKLNRAKTTGIDSFTGNMLPVTLDSIDINVVQTGSIEGMVLDQATGLPIQGSTVELRLNGQLIATDSTDIGGGFSFSQLVAGNYDLVVSYPNYTTKTQAVAVVANQVTSVTVFLEPILSTIQGNIRDTSTNPIASADILLLNSFGNIVQQTTSDGNGFYQFTSLPPSSYTIQVTKSGFQSASQSIILNANETRTIDFILLTSPGRVVGTVTDQASNPINGVVVEILDSNQVVVATTTTNNIGQYEVNALAPGSYLVRFTATNFIIAVIGFSVAAGETAIVDATLAPAPGSLQGTVTDGNTGLPLENVNVVVVDHSNVIVAEAFTDANGYYQIPSLAPENYSVTFIKSGYASTTLGTIISPNMITTLDVALNTNAGALRGTVTTLDGTPIENTSIKVFLNNVLVNMTTTDANGSYEINNLGPGVYTVTATAENFQAKTSGATIEAHQITIVDFQLIENPGGIFGSVTDAVGNPINGAEISIRENSVDGPEVAVAVTDTNGNYSVSNLAPGNYVAIALANGFQSAIAGATVVANVSTEVNFTLQSNPGSIGGKITNANTGSPIQGARVEVRIININGVVIETIFTDNQGDYLATLLEPGNYTVVAFADGFQFGSGSTLVQAGQTSIVNIALLPNPGRIIGIISDATTGIGIPGALVNITLSGAFITTVVTDNSGSYTVEGLSPGNYVVEATANGFQNGFVGAIVSPNITTPANIQLEKNPGAIFGYVEPRVPGVIIKLFTNHSVLISTVVTDGNGNFRFDNLAPGEYVVTASHLNFATKAEGATVLAGEETQVIFNLDELPGSISGNVTNRTTGEPIPNARIQVQDLNEKIIGTVFTDSNGNYSIGGIPSGTFFVIASADNFSTATRGVNLTTGQDLIDINFRLQEAPGGISGTITNAVTGGVIEGATVEVRLAGTQTVVASTVTSPFGNYLIENLLPGKYTIGVTKSGFGEGTRGVIVITGETTDGSLSLNPVFGQISGYILDQDGNRITGNNTSVILRNENGILIASGFANSDGSYHFFNVTPGRYYISASAPDFATNQVFVNVVAGEVTNANIILSKNPATLKGSVVNSETGELIRCVVITVRDNNGIVIATGSSCQDGNFIIPNLPAGSFVVVASVANFGSEAQGVILNQGETKTIQFRLTPFPGRVTGVVTSLNSAQGIVGATVKIYNSFNALIATTLTGTAGRYVFEGLAPGNYWAVASAPGFVNQLGSFVIVSNETSYFSFVLDENPAIIRGKVTNEINGRPIEGAVIQVRRFNSFDPILATAFSDTEGNYEITGLSSGNYVIIANKDNFEEEITATGIAKGETQIIDFSLRPNLSEINGRIINAISGLPVPNSLIRLVDETGVIIQTVQSNVDGYYQMKGIFAGDYFLVASNGNKQTNTKFISIGFNEKLTINFDLDDFPGSVTGVITDKQNGKVIPGATVEVVDVLNNVIQGRDITDEKGRYIIVGLAPGRYIITVSKENYGSASKDVNIQESEQEIVNLQLESLYGTVKGTVLDENNNPLYKVIVEIFDINDNLVRLTITNFDGEYEISNLAPGTYFIVFSYPGKKTVVKKITITANETKILNVILLDEGEE